MRLVVQTQSCCLTTYLNPRPFPATIYSLDAIHLYNFAITGNKVLAFFDVLSWGYGAYVNLYVTGPNGHEIQKFEAESEGRVDFIAGEDGEHSFCFKNAHTETDVSFWINTETDSALSDVAKEGTLTLVCVPITIFLYSLLTYAFPLCLVFIPCPQNM